jgi:hypothetical protein
MALLWTPAMLSNSGTALPEGREVTLGTYRMFQRPPQHDARLWQEMLSEFLAASGSSEHVSERFPLSPRQLASVLWFVPSPPKSAAILNI